MSPRMVPKTDRIRTHSHVLQDGPLFLRPMTENDWQVLYRWNSDPEVLYFAEGGDITSWSMEDMQTLYRNTSLTAYVFAIELKGTPIGECWLQEMSLERVLRKYPGRDVRRIDFMIGEKALWGKGWGTRVIPLMVDFAFRVCAADLIYEPEIADYNLRSIRAFQRNGFRIVEGHAQERGTGAPAPKARSTHSLALERSADHAA